MAISNSRLIRFDENSVTFKVKDYRLKGAGRQTTMTLTTSEFIRQFLIHVLLRGPHRIRHYGFFGNSNRAAKIARIRQLLRAKTPDPQHIDDADKPPRVLALPMLWWTTDHRRDNRTSAAPQSTAKTKKGRNMTRAPYIANETRRRRLYLL